MYVRIIVPGLSLDFVCYILNYDYTHSPMARGKRWHHSIHSLRTHKITDHRGQLSSNKKSLICSFIWALC